MNVNIYLFKQIFIKKYIFPHCATISKFTASVKNL